MNTEGSNSRIIEFDLYEIALEILEDKNYLDKVFKMKTKGSPYVFNAIKKTLRLTQ